MFKPHLNICSDCGNESIVVVKKMLCARCNHKQKEAKKKLAGKKTGGYKYVREASGEGEMFAEIALNRLGDEITRCFVCGCRISVVTHNHMAHILPKGKYPLMKLEPDNIVILCHRLVADKDAFQGCHYRWDMEPRSKIANNPEWQKLIELETQLKERYKRITE